MNGSVARQTSSTGRLKRYDARKMLSPTSGVRNPSSRLATKMMPEMDRVDAERGAERHDQRHDDDDRGEDLHEPADDQQEHVEREQEREARLDVRPHPLDQLRRQLHADQVVGQADGDAENHQHAADHDGALDEHAQQIPAHVQVAVDDGLDEKRVAGGQRRGLDRRRNPAEHATRSRRPASPAPISPPTATRPPPPRWNRWRAGAGDMPSRTPHAAIIVVSRMPGRRPPMNRSSIGICATTRVEDQRQRRRQQQAERAGRR